MALPTSCSSLEVPLRSAVPISMLAKCTAEVGGESRLTLLTGDSDAQRPRNPPKSPNRLTTACSTKWARPLESSESAIFVLMIQVKYLLSLAQPLPPSLLSIILRRHKEIKSR